MSVVKRLGAASALLLLLGAGSVVFLKRAQRRAHHVLDVVEAKLSPRVAKPFDVADAAEVVYDGRLMPGWSDWGWGPHELPERGPAKVVFAGFGGIILQHSLLQDQYAGLSFRYRAPASFSSFLQVALKFPGHQGADAAQVRVLDRHIAPLPDGFSEVFIRWDELDPSRAPFERIVISAAAQVGGDAVLLDKILLLRADAADAVSATQRSAELEVQCSGRTHQISPLIYGAGDGDWESGMTARRMGGNPTSRYNWELDAWNSANDWFFENQRAPNLRAWLDDGVKHDASAALTVPMIGWIAKDTTSAGFPVSGPAGAQKVDPSRPQAGNGKDARGELIPPGPATQTSVAASPELIGRFIKNLRERDLVNGKRSVKSYILDNEPSLWNETHRDVHPDPLTYDELLERTIRYAAEIRKADPEGQIAGPAEWGWLGYWYSARDRVQGKLIRSDRRAHGDEPLIPWYLEQLARYQKDHGARLLDVLDVHFYPAADGIYGANAKTDRAASELRLRSTRALWDPSYVDESWIDEPIKLIPLLKSWVASKYPGLRISLGEWSFGADEHISGALATAEALGRFGQQGLDSAYYWGGPKRGSGAFWAFRAFRNFDGAGGRFLDVSLPAREAEQVSLFASRDESRTHIVAILVNRDPESTFKAQVALSSCGSLKAQRVFRFSAGSSSLVEAGLEASGAGRLVVQLPPFSISVLDLRVEPPPGSTP